jgi:hypothetical protein
MAEKPMKKLGQTPDGEDIYEHPLAASLRESPADFEHLVTLTGYPGESSVDDNIRLYLHHDFQSYYEIEQKDIRHIWPATATDGTTEPVNVAINANAKPHLVVHTTVSSASAALLKGPMVTSFLTKAIESASISAQSVSSTPPPPPPPHGGIIEPPQHRGKRHRYPKPPE